MSLNGAHTCSPLRRLWATRGCQFSLGLKIQRSSASSTSTRRRRSRRSSAHVQRGACFSSVGSHCLKFMCVTETLQAAGLRPFWTEPNLINVSVVRGMLTEVDRSFLPFEVEVLKLAVTECPQICRSHCQELEDKGEKLRLSKCHLRRPVNMIGIGNIHYSGRGATHHASGANKRYTSGYTNENPSNSLSFSNFTPFFTFRAMELVFLLSSNGVLELQSDKRAYMSPTKRRRPEILHEGDAPPRSSIRPGPG